MTSKYRIEILSPAVKDIERIAAYHLRMVGPNSAEKITDKLLDTIQVLEDQPFSGTEHSDEILRRQNFRKLICGDNLCIYKIVKAKIYIYRVVHGTSDYPKLLK